MANQQLSLRQCAMIDAAKHGPNAMAELQAEWRRRKMNKQRGKKTNVGDPNRNMSSGKRSKG